MSRARNRPPKLEPRSAPATSSLPPTPEQLLERAQLAGSRAGAGPGPTELRRYVERLAAGDRHAFGDLAPVDGLTVVEGWAALEAVFGATPGVPHIDPVRTTAAIARAVERVRAVATAGGRIAIATARPASLLSVYMTFAAQACARGADVADAPDAGPIRADGRAPRWLRWIGRVAVVTDGHALCETRDGEAAREWMFIVPRPALVIADTAFAEVAWESGVEVVALAGLDRPGLAIPAARDARCTVVPLRTDRPPRSYEPLQRLVEASFVTPEGGGADEATDAEL